MNVELLPSLLFFYTIWVFQMTILQYIPVMQYKLVTNAKQHNVNLGISKIVELLTWSWHNQERVTFNHNFLRFRHSIQH